MVGMWLRELALAAVFATIFSLIMSFTLNTDACIIIIKEGHHKRKWAELIEKWEALSTRWYSRILGFYLKQNCKFFGWQEHL
jgi:multidrug efflux pump subunit AcrB